MHSPPHYKLVCPHTSYQCNRRCILIYVFLVYHRDVTPESKIPSNSSKRGHITYYLLSGAHSRTYQ